MKMAYDLTMRKDAAAISVKMTVDGFVEGPADEIDAEATYTFEGTYEGRRYRWMNQRPVISGDRVRFYLHDGQPIDT
jgi:hypothetical protein